MVVVSCQLFCGGSKKNCPRSTKKVVLIETRSPSYKEIIFVCWLPPICSKGTASKAVFFWGGEGGARFESSHIIEQEDENASGYLYARRDFMGEGGYYL